MRNIVITQRLNSFVRIFVRTGFKVFSLIFGVYNIEFASPDYHLPEIDSVFYLNHGMMSAVKMCKLM